MHGVNAMEDCVSLIHYINGTSISVEIITNSNILYVNISYNICDNINMLILT